MNNISLILPLIADGEDKENPLKNRIRKNYKHLRKWAKRELCDCFRIYDRDIKEYPLTIDFYAGRFSIHYFSFDRSSDEPDPALKKEVFAVLSSLFDVQPDLIYERIRVRRKKLEQYEKVSDQGEFFNVYEFGAQFRINLKDYLDSGLFLDHRRTRQYVASQAKGKRVLNLFAYTASFSVHAAMAGASFTKSVDLSNTYTDWAAANFKLNHLSLEKNEIVRADCLRFLDEEVISGSKYDLIVIDPPTLSRSKKMEKMFDIQVDCATLLTKGSQLLNKGGKIVFSTNSRQFHFDLKLLKEFRVVEITEKTIPQDFHNKKIHRCWEISL